MAANRNDTYDDATHSVYERATFGGRLTLGSNPAILVVDFSWGFTDPASPLGANMDDAVLACREVLDSARDSGHLIVYTTVAYDSDRDAGLTIQKSPANSELKPGSRWMEVDSRLEPQPDEPVIVKKRPSAFFGTELAGILTEKGIDTVVLCGATTSGCIRATAIDLFQYGYPTLVPADCVADRADGPHEANLFDMNAKYADVVTKDEALAYLASVPVRPTTT